MEYIHRNIKTKYIFTTNLYKIWLNDSVLSNIGTWNIFLISPTYKDIT